MSKKNIQNISASILQRLKNYAGEHQEEYGLTLTRYAIERFLYRLSQSNYAGQFVLKGAQLFRLWTDSSFRPTRDLDLLRYGSPDMAELEAIFRNICEMAIDVPDGIMYLPKTVRGQVIREENEYDGVRIRFEYRIDKVGQFMQIDIGFGDVTVPPVEECSFPSMLDLPAANLKAYSRETVIAEKVQAMVFLGMANSRMKDFFDVCKLAESFEFDGRVLSKAIQSTFSRRDTAIPSSPPLALTSEFPENQTKNKQWQAFLKRSSLESQLTRSEFTDVIQVISGFVMPVFQAINSGSDFKSKWGPTEGWI